MVRVDMENLGFDSINKYAIGDAGGSRYTNVIPMFARISFARLHNEISGLQVRVRREGDAPQSGNWKWLYQKLKQINGIAEVSNA